MANDILASYVPATGQFRSLGFNHVGDRFDCKIHKGFEEDGEGNFLFGTASLHDPNQQEEAKGGKLVRFNPNRESFEVLTVPVPKQYIQNIAFDRNRGLIYGMTFPMEYLFRHDINSGKTRILGHVGGGQFMGQPHYPVVAPDGTLWAAWGRSQAWVMKPTPHSCLLRYHPDDDRVHYLTAGPACRSDQAARQCTSTADRFWQGAQV
jgi:sugar lactone lactonase YvrE